MDEQAIRQLDSIERRLEDLETRKTPSIIRYVLPPTGIAATDTANLQAVHDNATAGDEIWLQAGTYLLNAPLTITKQITLASGGGTVLKVSSGAGAIKIIDTDHVRLQNFKIDLNSVASAIGIYHLGGWYVHASDIWMDKSHEGAGGYGVQIESVNAGGGDGDHGSFVGYYENITCNRVNIVGANPMSVTTMTFTNLDCSNIITLNARALTFLQPVIQQTGGIHFDLSYTDGLTCLGGDFEGTGTIYNIGAGCRGIVSVGNLMGGFTGTYRSTVPAAHSVFFDYDENVNRGWDLMGGLIHQTFQNPTFTSIHNIGLHYDGNILQLGANLTGVTSTTANLADVAQAGFLITLNTSGQMVFQTCTSGANPRTLTEIATFDILGPSFKKALRLPVSTAEPGGVTNGMIAYADGASWDPGAGAGFYGREAGAWVKL